MTSRRFLAASGIVVAAAVLALGGCHSDPGHVASSSPSHSVPAAPSATTASKRLAPGDLLRVSAVAVADDGTRVRIVETVTGPTASDGGEDAAMTAADCSGDGYTWKADFPGAPQWIHLDMTARLLSGTAWPSDGDHDIFLQGASGADIVAWTGSWRHAQAFCASGYAVIPGHATGVAPVAGEADARTSWQTGVFGFGWDWSERDAAPPSVKVKFDDCTLELSAAARPFDSRFTRPAPDPVYGQACSFGTPPS